MDRSDFVANGIEDGDIVLVCYIDEVRKGARANYSHEMKAGCICT